MLLEFRYATHCDVTMHIEVPERSRGQDTIAEREDCSCVRVSRLPGSLFMGSGYVGLDCPCCGLRGVRSRFGVMLSAVELLVKGVEEKVISMAGVELKVRCS
jgi:hypothetical protein